MSTEAFAVDCISCLKGMELSPCYGRDVYTHKEYHDISPHQTFVS
jgi:hypothetical protein